MLPSARSAILRPETSIVTTRLHPFPLSGHQARSNRQISFGQGRSRTRPDVADQRGNRYPALRSKSSELVDEPIDSLNLGERVRPVLEALQAASPNRLRGIR